MAATRLHAARSLCACAWILSVLGVAQGFVSGKVSLSWGVASKGGISTTATGPRCNSNKRTSPSMVYIPPGDEQPVSNEGANDAGAPSVGLMKLPMDRNAFLALSGVAGVAGLKWATNQPSRSEQRKLAREATVAKITSEEPPIKETPAEARRRRQDGKQKEGGGALETTVFVAKSVAKGVATVATVCAPLIVKAAEFVGRDVLLPTAQFTGEHVIPTVVPAVRHAVEASAPALLHVVQASAPVVRHAVDEATPLAAPLVESAGHAFEGAERSVLPMIEQARAAADTFSSSSSVSLAALRDTSASAFSEALRPAIAAADSAVHATGDTTAVVMAKVQPVVEGAEGAAKSVQELSEGVREAVEPAMPALQATWGFAQGAYTLASTAVSSVQEQGFGNAMLRAAGQAGSAVGAFVVDATPKVLQFAEAAAEAAFLHAKAAFEAYVSAQQDTPKL